MDVQILDFYHVRGYLKAMAVAVHPDDATQQRYWSDEHCHHLRHVRGAAQQLYEQVSRLIPNPAWSPTLQDNLRAAITYSNKHQH